MYQWCFSNAGIVLMVGKGKGFATLVKQENPSMETTHYCLHREALMIKVLPEELSETMNDCIKHCKPYQSKSSKFEVVFIAV